MMKTRPSRIQHEQLVEEAGGRSELIRSSYTFTQDALIQRLGAQAPVELKYNVSTMRR